MLLIPKRMTEEIDMLLYEDENHQHRVRDPLKRINYSSCEEAEAGFEAAIMKLSMASSKDGIPLWTMYAADEIVEAHHYLMNWVPKSQRK